MSLDLPDPVTHFIDQITVMTDYQHSSVKDFQRRFHRFFRQDIQMVGRFVQNQQVRAIQYQLQ